MKQWKKAIEIRCSSNDQKMRIRESIHNQLVGNEDYIDNNIILNLDEDCKVLVVIFNECKEEPTIIM